MDDPEQAKESINSLAGTPALARDGDDSPLAGVEQLLALPREPAPEGFADRVMARVAKQPQAHPFTAPHRVSGRHLRPSRWLHRFAQPRRAVAPLGRVLLAAGLCLALGLPGAWAGLHYHREQQSRAAARQFDFAIELTRTRLDHAGRHAAHFIDNRRQP